MNTNRDKYCLKCNKPLVSGDSNGVCQECKEKTKTEYYKEFRSAKMKQVYIIMSPSGGISLDISTNEGKCYEDLEVAKKELEATNRWSRGKGYGVYELITLNVVEVVE